MAKTTSDSILGVIRKESWILDHFEIFVNIMLGGGLRFSEWFSSLAFYSYLLYLAECVKLIWV